MLLPSSRGAVPAELSGKSGIPVNFFGRWGVFDGVHPRAARRGYHPQPTADLTRGHGSARVIEYARRNLAVGLIGWAFGGQGRRRLAVFRFSPTAMARGLPWVGSSTRLPARKTVLVLGKRQDRNGRYRSAYGYPAHFLGCAVSLGPIAARAWRAAWWRCDIATRCRSPSARPVRWNRQVPAPGGAGSGAKSARVSARRGQILSLFGWTVIRRTGTRTLGQAPG